MSDTIIIHIDDGQLTANLPRKILWSGPANRWAAKRLGKFLQDTHPHAEVMYSSSIDFPHENGGTRTNFRVAIAEGRGVPCDEVWDPINGGERP